jgi:hypothetical protein
MSDETNRGVAVEDEVIDLEEFAKAGKKPPHAKKYRIRIDKTKYIVEVREMTGRQLLELAGKKPPDQYILSQKLHGGEVKVIMLDEKVDFTERCVERFMTMAKDQTEG